MAGIKAHYVAKDGGHLNGIPARSLSDEEYAALSGEQKRAVRSSGLYRMEGKEPEQQQEADTPPKDEA